MNSLILTGSDLFTGQLIAHVSWQCEQSNPDIQVSGYKVLIDGKQYGNAMHEGVKTVRIKVKSQYRNCTSHIYSAIRQFSSL